MNILKRLGSDAMLLLLDVDSTFTRDNILKQALFHGVSLTRIAFLGKLKWEQHLDRAGACDVVLDTFVYGAHTTCSDMIWMGVPVIALESK